MNKIYFAGSIRGGREDVTLYLSIVNHLKTHGRVLTEHVANNGLALMGEDGLADREIHERDMGWLTEANSIVAEVTKASLGVGYEIGRIVERNLWISEKSRKQILCLYRPQVDRVLSAMIKGSNGVKNLEYQKFDDARGIIDEFFKAIN